MKYKLQELAKIKYGKNQKKVASDYGNIPIYGTGGLMGWANECLYDKPSVLIGRKGTIEKIRYVEHPFWTVDTLFYTMINTEKVRPHFFYYLMSQVDLKKYNEGTTIPSLRTETLNRMEFDVPPFDIQDRILSIIEPIEDKILINNKINNNLQQQMSAIYKKKFSYVLQGNTTTIEQLIAFSNGKKRPNEEGDIPVYGGNGILAYTNRFNSNNCIIIGRVGAYCGNVSYYPKECWVSDNAIEAKSKVSDSQLFAYHLLKNAELPSRHIGTGQPLMTQGILNAIPCSMPDTSEIDAFNKLCEPLQQQIDTNLTENAQLSALRETILPKLMSGELDVSDIQL